MKTWLLRIMSWTSQTINLFLLFGHHDMSISCRCYINREKKYWKTARKIVDKIFFFEKDHCRRAFESDLSFAKEIIKIEKSKEDEL